MLFNSIVRRNFGVNPDAVAADDIRPEKDEAVVEGDTLIDTHGKYLESPRNVAKEMDVCFIDLNQATKKLVESYGVEGSKNYLCGFLLTPMLLVRRDVRIILT